MKNTMMVKELWLLAASAGIRPNFISSGRFPWLTQDILDEAMGNLGQAYRARLLAASGSASDKWVTLDLPRIDGSGMISHNRSAVMYAIKNSLWRLQYQIRWLKPIEPVAKQGLVCPSCGVALSVVLRIDKEERSSK